MIYVIRDGSYVKIGITSQSADDRLKALQTGNPRELKLVHVCDVGPMDVDLRSIEAMVHKQLEDCRARGEWFQCSPMEAKETIKYCCDNYKSLHSYAGEDKMPARVAYVALRKDLAELIPYDNDEWIDGFMTSAVSKYWQIQRGEKILIDSDQAESVLNMLNRSIKR